MKRHSGHNGNMAKLDTQQPNTVEVELLWNKHIERRSKTELAETQLNCHLLQTGHAEQLLVTVIFNQRPRFLTHLWAAHDEPEEAVSVQKEFHLMYSLKSSSG